MTLLDQLMGKLIVSCQAQPGSPLNVPEVIAAIAEASMLRGAAGVRIEGPDRVRAVRDRLPNAPIIGLWKQTIVGFSPYITPQFHHAQAIATAGADIIAIDATDRPRPDGETVPEIVRRIHDELGKLVMADVDSITAAEQAIAAGVDLVGTTLFGYTEATATATPPGFDLLQQLVTQFTTPPVTSLANPPQPATQARQTLIICEGGIHSPQTMAQAFAYGADAVVVGTAITGIDLLVDQYIAAVPAPSIAP